MTLHSNLSVCVGTKGMIIKTAGILRELDKRGIEYKYINLGQHGKRMSELNDLFNLQPFDVNLSREEDLSSITSVMTWFVKQFLLNRKVVKNDVVLVQGDTPATLLGYLMGSTTKSNVAHVEAGLRSYNFYNPFPEEIIRRIVDRGSEYLFPPSQKAFEAIESEGLKGTVKNTNQNTVLDSIRLALDADITIDYSDYVLVTIHRVENLYSKKRMNKILRIINEIENKIIWPLHEPTRKYIKSNVDRKLNDNIEFIPLQDYFTFVHLMKNALYIITDGGGPQEESSILGTPCLLMREKTERADGIGISVVLSEFKDEKINYFMKNFEQLRGVPLIRDVYPSKIIVDELESHI